jgi:hypothetical protein
MSHDFDYIQRRAHQERDAAAAASTEHSRRVHLELASRYEAILLAYDMAKTRAA